MKMTLRIVIFGGLIVFFAVVLAAVFIPVAIWNPPQTVIAHPYSASQERGRVLFYSNGCNYCHTQYVRAEDTAMGPVSQGGNYVFDNPVILGSERTGPDLSYVGRKRSEQWEIEHLKSPRDYSPLSIMPRFGFLSDDQLRDVAAYLFALGDRNAAAHMIPAPAEYVTAEDSIPFGSTKPSPDDQGWATWIAADLQKGKEVYIDKCMTCHGCSGNGLGTYAGTLAVTPANFKQEPFKDMPDEQWFWHVSEGVPGSVMPPWKESLSKQDRWRAIRYVKDTFARPIMRDPAEGDPPGKYADLTNPVPLTAKTLAEGKAIFTRECMVCHGASGRGSGPYAKGLQPSPPDFGDGSYGTVAKPKYADAGYFWRISEGLPWSAMPTWRLRYSEEDRWKLTHYIRVTFTQTEVRPKAEAPQAYPAIYLAQTMPVQVSHAKVIEGGLPRVLSAAPSFERGKVAYLRYCAECHGLGGKGDGWQSKSLNVSAGDLTSPKSAALSDGDYYARTSLGVWNTSMPAWGEWLPEQERWNALLFIRKGLQDKKADMSSRFKSSVANNVLTISSKNWTDEGHVISAKDGGATYETYCRTCHGAVRGPAPAGGPAAFPANMPEAYVFWRTNEGVPGTAMPPFGRLLPEKDIWNVTAYMKTGRGK